ncbi:MAG: hypothetical protein HY898_07090 [Deltaproteobacteria bacterium]|nr:hypothetical protein [Deltaproteobacteria bacterium]
MAGFTGWCWVDDSGVFRHARTEEVRSAIAAGSVTVDILVWREGMAAFLPARVFAAFSDLATGDLSQAATPGSSAQLPGEPIEPTLEQQAAYRRTMAVTASSVPATSSAALQGAVKTAARAPRSEAPPAARAVRRPSVPPSRAASKSAETKEHVLDDMPTARKAPFPSEDTQEDMPTIPRAGLPLTQQAVDELLEPAKAAAPAPKPEPAKAAAPAPKPEPAKAAAPAPKPEPAKAVEPKTAPAKPAAPEPKVEPSKAPEPEPALAKPIEAKQAEPAGKQAVAEDKDDAPEESTAKFAPPPPGFRGVSAEFFKEGEEIEQRWPREGSASQPDLISSARISMPGPEIEIQPLSLWQGIGLRVRHEKWFWWMVAGLGAIVLLGMSGLLVPLFRSKPEPMAPSSPAGPEGATAAAAPGAAQSAPAIPSSAPASASVAACVVAHAPERVANTAWKEVLPETWVAQDGSRFAVGFAAGVLKAAGLVIELPSLRVSKTINKPAFRPIRRVVPLAQGSEPSFAVDDDDPTLRMKKPVTVPSTRPARVGWTKDALVVAERGSKATTLIWARPAGDPGDSVRAFGLGSSGLAMAFRQSDILWMGFTDETFKPKGSLQRVQGTGTKVSSPSLGWNGKEAAIAFANESNGAWQLRVATARPGEPPSVSEPLAIPPGGPGGLVASPSIASVDDGRWLVVWTEGDGNARVVRAQTCDGQLRPAGAPLEISPPAGGAGQAVVAMASGKGAVAYLTAAGAIHQVWATSIACP